MTHIYHIFWRKQTIKKLWIALVFLVSYELLTAQIISQNAIDSLWKTFPNLRIDSSRVNLLTQISVLYQQNNPDSCFALAERAFHLANKIGFSRGEYMAWRMMGIGYCRKGAYREALFQQKSVLTKFPMVVKNKEIATSYNDIGEIYFYIGDFDSCKIYYELALQLLEKGTNQKGIADALIGLATAHNSKGNYTKALEYAQKGLTQSEICHYKLGMANAHNKIGEIFTNEASSKNSFLHYFEAIKINQSIDNKQGIAFNYNNIGNAFEVLENNDSCLFYYQKSYNLYKEIGDKWGMGLSVLNIGYTLEKENKLLDAEKYCTESYNICKGIGDKEGQSFALMTLAKIYSRLGKSTIAIQNAKQSMEIAREIGSKLLQKDNTEILYLVYEEKKDYANALIYYKLYSAYQDSLFSEDTQNKVHEMEKEFEYDKKLTSLKLSQTQKDKEIQQQRYLRNAFIIAFLFMIALSLNMFFNRKTIMEAREQAIKASNAKSEFLANMSHEIRTPLNGVIGFSDLMMQTPLTEQQKQYMSTVYNSANSLLAIINDILDFSKIEAGKLELSSEKIAVTNLCKESSDIIRFQAQQKNLTIALDIAPNVPNWVLTDALRLKQILINLLGNAVKFTNKGEILLKVESLKQVMDRHTLRFSVKDTGIGIAPENLQKIFEAFSQEDASTTRNFGGTGLGLSISNKLLGLMNSKLEVESILGKGSTFYFELVLKSEQTALPHTHNDTILLMETPQKNTVDKQQYDGTKILIVEDNEINIFLARTILTQLYPNIKLVEAYNGEEAIEQFQAEKPDLILMDIQMPKMNGYEATQAIRSLDDGKNVPIIALTAGIVMGEKEKCLNAGMSDFMSKPVLKETVSKMLQKWLVPIEKKQEITVISQSQDTEPHFNKAILLEKVGNDEAVLTHILSLVYTDLGKSLTLMNQHFEAKNQVELRKVAHKLKGTALSTSFDILAEKLKQLEGFQTIEHPKIISLMKEIGIEIEYLKTLLLNQN